MGIIRRKIEKSVEATMNVGDMQFLKIRSSMTQDVEEADETGLVAADSKMWNDLAKDIRRGMWKLLNGLGKTTDADKKFFEACDYKVQEATAASKQQEGEKV